MKKSDGKKVKLLKGEKIMYILLLGLIILIPVVNVFSSALLSETNINVEELESKISKQNKTNESLAMQVNELASLQNIQTIAETYGLSYTNGNIKVIEGE